MSRYSGPLVNTIEYKSLLKYFSEGFSAVSITGLTDSARAHFTAALGEDTDKNILYILPGESEAKRIADDLRFFAGDNREVLYFPPKDYVFHNVEAMNQDVIYDRLSVMHTLVSSPKSVIVVASAQAVVQYTAPCELLNFISFTEGDVFNLEELAEKLIFMGYIRADAVEGPGQFSLRGGILDIFSPGEIYPVRIEFFDDEVDTVRSFDPSTQISVSRLAGTKVLCCRELIYTKETVDFAIKKLKNKAAENENIAQDIEKFQNRHYFSAADKYLPYLYKNITTIADYFTEDIIVFDNPAAIDDKIKNVRLVMAEDVQSLVDKELLVYSKKMEYVEKFEHICEKGKFKVALSGIASHNHLIKPNASVNFAIRPMQSYMGKEELILEDIAFWHKEEYGINIVAGGKKSVENFVNMLNDNGYFPVVSDKPIAAEKGEIVISSGSVTRGFEFPGEKYVLVGEKELFGGEKNRIRTRKMAGTRIKSYSDLEEGDYVVHHIHGIGRYLGIHRMEVDGITKDYLKLIYKDNDILYIPATALHLINKYVAAETGNVKLNKMGGAEFAKVKSRVKKSAQDMADKLVKLYAARLECKGHPFSKDSDWQKNFEDDFPYTETDDQLRCINEVKADMEKIQPMDRLLCGDVGFGKTEVALRAAFKAVMDGKQVAYLVPTTVLARQHYNTFMSRMAQYPITVEMMCRFRTPKQQKEIAKRVKEGVVDIVIGTHRILQKDMSFKDLGLLIIDEEQRFGVGDKEKIKELKNTVDVLTLSATPIPRTMHMAMIGIRDMSVLNEPPSNRYPVQTYVMEYDREVVREALIKELDRGGQVYYVFNRVEGIERVAAEIQNMAPDARVAVAHGQMSEKQLEDIMISAMEGEIDVLVCTTIIETGLDIPNINTIIIENADCMGLSQLYQLRGRVGRSTRRAYAYLTYRKNKEINETADKRLKSIRDFTEFGSGFKIALRDLEIRGAGNVLGPEQHGVMDAVGYDMYCKILGEAVQEAKGETVKEEIVTAIDIKTDAFIPDKYIESSNIRIEMYKRISSVETEADMEEILEELIDRFGEPPASVVNLVNISLIGKMAASVGISDINQIGEFLKFRINNTDEEKTLVKELCLQYKKRLMFIEDKKPHILMRITEKNNDTLFKNIKIILHAYKQLQNDAN